MIKKTNNIRVHSYYATTASQVGPKISLNKLEQGKERKTQSVTTGMQVQIQLLRITCLHNALPSLISTLSLSFSILLNTN